MNKIKTEEDFKKTIKFVELAPVNDTFNFMHKSYLNISLAGNEQNEVCCLYSTGQIDRKTMSSAFCNEPNAPLKFNKLNIHPVVMDARKDIIDLFFEMLRRKMWVTETTDIKEFDATGNETSYGNPDNVIISKRVTTTTKTEYFIDKSLDIEQVKLR